MTDVDVLTEDGPVALSAPPPKLRWGLFRSTAYRLLAIVVAIAVWQLAVVSRFASPAAIASPSNIVKAAGPLLTGSVFWSVLGNTVESWAIGLIVSLVVGIPVGLVLGASDFLYRFMRFSIDFLRTIPPVVLVPLALLLYGATAKMVFVLTVFGAIWFILLQTMYGVHQVDAVARDVARAYQFRARDRVFRLVLPSAAPFIATGIRLAATVSLLLVIGGELIGGAPGIGSQITLQQQAGQIPAMYVYIVVAGVLGVVLNLIMLKVERRVLRWHHAQRSTAP